MNRTERRAAARAEQKLARKAGFPTQPEDLSTAPTLPSEPAVAATPVITAAATPEPFLPSLSLANNQTASQPARPPLSAPDQTQPAKPSISEARLAANRANAQLSSGPKTESGRAISSQNHSSHGLTRHNGTFTLLTSEDPAGFEALKTAFATEHQPTTETESILITTMAESHWLANRAQNLQTSCFDPQTGQITDLKLFSLYLRYQTTHTRAFHKSLNDLLKLRAEKRKEANGFEAQKRKEEKRSLQILEYELKREDREWAQLMQNEELRADTTRLGMASLKRGPEYEALKEQFTARWSAPKEPQTAAA